MITRLSILGVILALAASAAADTATDLKNEGLEAAKAKNWETARKKFAQSYSLDPQPRTLYNLAVAQERTDQLLAARESFDTFVQQTPPGKDDRFRVNAISALAELDQTIPTLRIVMRGFASTVYLELDGVVLDPATLAAPRAMDPGAHVIVVRGEIEIARKDVVLARGARETVELDAPKLPPPAVDPVPPVIATPRKEPAERPPVRESRSVLRSPWLWGATGAVVLGAVYYFVYYSRPASTDGTLGSGTLEL